MSEADRQIAQAVQLLRRGDGPAAERMGRAVLAREGAHAGALLLLGMIEAERGNLDEAALHFEGAVVLQPQRPDAHFNLAVLRADQGRYDDAIAGFARTLALDPANEPAAASLADAFLRAGRLADALAAFDKALARSQRVDLWHKRGITQHALEDYEGALESHRKAIALAPQDAYPYNSAGVALTALGRHDEALEILSAAIALDPTLAVVWSSRAVAHGYLGAHDKAIADFERAVSLAPNDARIVANYGEQLSRFDRNEQAEAVLQRALVLNPQLAPTIILGNIQVDLGKFDDAMANFERAVAMAPDEPFALWCRALLNLRLGNLSEGFRDYEQRLKGAITGARRELPGVEWEPAGARAGPADRTLYVYGEQGFGDVIQFARYVPLLLERGHDVIFEVPPALVALMRSLDPRVTVIAAGAPVPPYDAYCPQPSLPAKLGTTLETIPAQAPYLRADAATTEAWTARCEDLVRPRVGLCWSGSPTHERDLRRSIPLALFRKLIDEGDATFVSLQKDVRPADADVLSGMTRVTDFTAEIRDFNDTAALIESLDLVVSVDTSIAHLAGALGKPVWVLLPIVPDWRWMAARDDSPWYPTAHLFRQTRSGDWSEVLERVAERLRAGI